MPDSLLRSGFSIAMITAMVGLAGCAASAPTESHKQTDVTCQQFETYTPDQRANTLSPDAAQRTVFEYSAESASSTDETDFFADVCADPANASKTLYDLRWANAMPTCEMYLSIAAEVRVKWVVTVQAQSEWSTTDGPENAAALLSEACGSTTDGSLLTAARLIQASIDEAAVEATREPLPDFAEQVKGRTITWRGESKLGYVTESTLAIGHVLGVPFRHPDDPTFLPGVACGFDSTKDVAIPMTLTYVNATSTDYQIASRFVLRRVAQSNGVTTGYLESQLNADGSEFCSTSTANRTDAVVGLESVNKLAAAKSITTLFFVIIKDYYSPRNPKGAPTELDDYILIGIPPKNEVDPIVAFETNRMTLTGKVSD